VREDEVSPAPTRAVRGLALTSGRPYNQIHGRLTRIEHQQSNQESASKNYDPYNTPPHVMTSPSKAEPSYLLLGYVLPT
jgi:hypothetical protein